MTSSGSTAAARPEDITRWRSDLQGEVDGITVYRAMQAHESDPALASVYGKLAVAE